MASLQLNLQTHYELSVDGFNEWVSSLPATLASHEFLAISVLFCRSIEPLVSANEPQLILKGDTLSKKNIESETFKTQIQKIRHQPVDPVILPLLVCTDTLSQSIEVKRTTTKIEKILKYTSFICRTSKQASVLESVRNAIKDFCAADEVSKQNQSYSLEVLAFDTVPEPTVFESHKESSIIVELLPLCSELLPFECLMVDYTLEQGIREDTTQKISFDPNDDPVVTLTTDTKTLELRSTSEQVFKLKTLKTT